MKLIQYAGAVDAHYLQSIYFSSLVARRRRWFAALSTTGDWYLHVATPILVALYDLRMGIELFFLILGAVAIERPIYLLLKNLLKRRRPAEILPSFCCEHKASDRFSLPSGHSMGAFLLATTLVLFFGEFAALAFVWAAAIAFSRVALGVHFPIDVVVGSVLGLTIALFSFEIFNPMIETLL